MPSHFNGTANPGRCNTLAAKCLIQLARTTNKTQGFCPWKLGPQGRVRNLNHTAAMSSERVAQTQFRQNPANPESSAELRK